VPRLLVTGASGLLGSNLIMEAFPHHEVIGLYHMHPIQHDSIHTAASNLDSKDSVARVIEDLRPDWIVNCAAATDVDQCEEDPDTAFLLNADMPGWIAEAAYAHGARLAHISTDAVFDGLTGGYRESDPPSPINVYGRSKVAGENAVQANHPGALVIRSNFFGWNAQSKDSLAEFFFAKLERGQSCNGFADVRISALLATDLAKLILAALDQGISGLYHIGSVDCYSKYEFGKQMATLFEFDGQLIDPISVDDARLGAPRPKNLCLDCSAFSKLADVELPILQKGLEGFRDQMSAGFRQQLGQLIGM
jgi:dTDP-4-dehydrorhamnose reductase